MRPVRCAIGPDTTFRRAAKVSSGSETKRPLMASRQTAEPSAPTGERTRWLGAAIERKEDPALLCGEGRFIDDLEPFPNLYHAAILRSPHAHARIRRIDATAPL